MPRSRKKYWLLKSEPDAFSINDLQARPKQTEAWDGVRNYQARNFMRDEMATGDLALFYHSRCALPGCVGVVTIASEPHADHTAFDPDSPYYDPKSPPDNPRWFCVDVAFKEAFARTVSLAEMKSCPELAKMKVVAKGNRLSVMPITRAEFDFIVRLSRKPAP
jgi:predicted RNA-binding protein with PUA-like domain